MTRGRVGERRAARRYERSHSVEVLGRMVLDHVDRVGQASTDEIARALLWRRAGELDLLSIAIEDLVAHGDLVRRGRGFVRGVST